MLIKTFVEISAMTKYSSESIQEDRITPMLFSDAMHYSMRLATQITLTLGHC